MFFVCHPVRFGQGEHYFIVEMGCCWQRFGSSADRYQASNGKHPQELALPFLEYYIIDFIQKTI